MSNLHTVFVAFIVTIVSLLIIFKLPLGIRIDDARKGFITAVIFAIIDAVSYPTLAKIGLPLSLLSPLSYLNPLISFKIDLPPEQSMHLSELVSDP